MVYSQEEFENALTIVFDELENANWHTLNILLEFAAWSINPGVMTLELPDDLTLEQVALVEEIATQRMNYERALNRA